MDENLSEKSIEWKEEFKIEQRHHINLVVVQENNSV